MSSDLIFSELLVAENFETIQTVFIPSSCIRKSSKATEILQSFRNIQIEFSNADLSLSAGPNQEIAVNGTEMKDLMRSC